MKTQLLFLSLGMFLLAVGCEDSGKSLYNSRKAISGTAYLNDTELKPNFLVPAKGVDIKLQTTDDSTETADYLYKATTNADGYFEFPYVPDEVASLYIRAQTDQSTIRFKGIMSIKKGKIGQDLELKPVYKNALKVTVLNSKKEPWHSVNTYLYANGTLAARVNSDMKIPTSGFIATQKTNERGIVIYDDLEVGKTYYVLVANTLSDGNLLFGMPTSVTIIKENKIGGLGEIIIP